MAEVQTVTIPADDYRRLLEIVELDDRTITCEVCGAWIDRDDPAYCTAAEFLGCWEAANHSGKTDLCRRYRVDVLAALPSPPASG